MKVKGALQLSPGEIVNTTLGASWGVNSWQIQPGIKNATWIRQVQDKVAAGVFSGPLTAIECLTSLSITDWRSFRRHNGSWYQHAILSWILTQESCPTIHSCLCGECMFLAGLATTGNAGIPTALMVGSQISGSQIHLLFKIGTFMDTSKWHITSKLDTGWLINVQTRIDYCLSSVNILNNMCSVEFSFPIMISKFPLQCNSTGLTVISRLHRQYNKMCEYHTCSIISHSDRPWSPGYYRRCYRILSQATRTANGAYVSIYSKPTSRTKN